MYKEKTTTVYKIQYPAFLVYFNLKSGLLQSSVKLSQLKDLTPSSDISVSSRQAMIASLTDNSTETFWESGDEDRNRSKFLTIKCHVKASARILYVHIDNARDLGVSTLTLFRFVLFVLKEKF